MAYNVKQMIFNIGKTSIWLGTFPFAKANYLPKTSFFDGGSYWKFSFYWLKFVIEFSGFKKDNTKYKEVTKQELDQILKGLK